MGRSVDLQINCLGKRRPENREIGQRNVLPNWLGMPRHAAVTTAPTYVRSGSELRRPLNAHAPTGTKGGVI